jgi:EAL domain-containing protein (putative c-di-GMP-specific phosphodiesterase class I)
VIRVELIDDHEMIVQSIARLLRDEPEIVVVGTALDATTGIELARVERPDVIIIDYSLPDMEAPSAIRILRTVCPEARIITVSGSEKPGAFYESLRAGSSAWVTKTRAIQELRDAIIRVAAGHPVPSEVWDSLPDLDDLVVHYQPVVEFTSGRTIGFEALVRWQHPQRGLLYPDQFLQFAENTGFIVEIDRRVWELAAQQLRAWRREFPHLPQLHMSVNISARDLSSPELFDVISKILTDYEIDPNDFIFEITESVLLDDTEGTIDFLTQLTNIGTRLALDDFGTGFSSLSYVRRFPFNVLKLEISFTSELPVSLRSMLLVDDICHLARSMGMQIIAEGIERKDQVDALIGMGCQYGQGYLYSRALPADACSALLTASKST